jgi:hypothetical protein
MTDTTAPADGAAAPEKNTDIPVQTSAAEPLVVAKDEPVAEAQAEQSTEAAAEPTTEGEGERGKPAKVPDWLQKKMAADAFEQRETARKLKAAEEELARLKAPKPEAAAQPTATDTAAAQQNAPVGGYKSQADFDAAVAAEAARREAAVRQQAETHEFKSKLDAAWTKGLAAYGDEDFNTVAANLNSVGFVPVQDPQTGAVGNTELMQLVLETDDPARVLFELGSDPAKAQAVMSLPPAKRAIEIAKLAITPPAEKAKPTPLSNAPRPIVPVEGSAKPNSEPSDSDDDAAWFAKRNAEVQRRYQSA